MRTTIAFDLDTLPEKLRHAAAREARALSRLRRWQTAYDKYHAATLRIQSQVIDALTETKTVADRLRADRKAKS